MEATPLHSGLKQPKRLISLDKFKGGASRPPRPARAGPAVRVIGLESESVSSGQMSESSVRVFVPVSRFKGGAWPASVRVCPSLSESVRVCPRLSESVRVVCPSLVSHDKRAVRRPPMSKSVGARVTCPSLSELSVRIFISSDNG